MINVSRNPCNVCQVASGAVHLSDCSYVHIAASDRKSCGCLKAVICTHVQSLSRYWCESCTRWHENGTKCPGETTSDHAGKNMGFSGPEVKFDSSKYLTSTDTWHIKDTNPKAAIGITKVPLHLVSPIMKAYMSIAQYLGNVKYGAWNWRGSGARASTYVSALYRHIDRWWEGEELDPDDGTPHLANAMTCLQILIEAKYRGVLEDDRPPATNLQPLYDEIQFTMDKIREKYKDRSPHHYTQLEDPSVHNVMKLP